MIGLGTESSREIARWAICGVIVLAAHGGAAAVLGTWIDLSPPGAPQSAILLDMSSSDGAPPAPKSDVPPAEQDSQYQELVPDPPKKIEKEELEPPKEIVERTPEPEIERPPEPPRQQAEVALPPPTPPKPVQKKQKTASIDSRRVSSDVASERVTGAPPGARGDIQASYNQIVVAHLARHKNYPRNAAANHIEGTVMLSFMLSHSGNVVTSRITRGSGHAELDQEALEMLKRAQPFPTPPAQLSGQQLLFHAPMRYYQK